MRVTLLLLCLVLPITARATTPTQQAEAEARHYLSHCQLTDKDWQSRCLSNQYNFIVAYVYAMSGDVSSMGAIAAAFTPANRSSQDDANDHIGLPVSFEQACAWRIAVATAMKLVSDAASAGALCVGLVVHDITAAEARAQQILTLIQTAPAAPAADWDPDLPGLPRAPKVNPACLTSAVTPLTPVPDDTPAPLPPKGCPGNP